MDRLPLEIIESIIDQLDHIKNYHEEDDPWDSEVSSESDLDHSNSVEEEHPRFLLSTYSVLNSLFQAAVEKFTFKSLELTTSDLPQLQKMIANHKERLHFVRDLIISFPPLHSGGADPKSLESPETWKHHNKALTELVTEVMESINILGFFNVKLTLNMLRGDEDLPYSSRPLYAMRSHTFKRNLISISDDVVQPNSTYNRISGLCITTLHQPFVDPLSMITLASKCTQLKYLFYQVYDMEDRFVGIKKRHRYSKPTVETGISCVLI
jgi:hypothetical protein